MTPEPPQGKLKLLLVVQPTRVRGKVYPRGLQLLFDRAGKVVKTRSTAVID